MVNNKQVLEQMDIINKQQEHLIKQFKMLLKIKLVVV
jgi:hypothetical protein